MVRHQKPESQSGEPAASAGSQLTRLATALSGRLVHGLPTATATQRLAVTSARSTLTAAAVAARVSSLIGSMSLSQRQRQRWRRRQRLWPALRLVLSAGGGTQRWPLWQRRRQRLWQPFRPDSLACGVVMNRVTDLCQRRIFGWGHPVSVRTHLGHRADDETVLTALGVLCTLVI